MRRVGVLLVLLAGGALFLLTSNRAGEEPSADPQPTEASWAWLDQQGRCDQALELVTYPQRWPTVCRWRQPGEAVQAESSPPPPGPPPYEQPRVDVYVAPEQSREQLASVIAHEFGHMHHTREFAAWREWLAARNLDPQTPAEVWTEDYAEVFAVLFGPPTERWRAPTPRPSPGALADLKARFFS